MAAAGENELAVVKDLDSLAVQFGQSLLESDLKAFDESSDTGNYEIKSENVDEDEVQTKTNLRTDFHNINFKEESLSLVKEEPEETSDTQSQSVSEKQKVYRCEDCGQCYLKPSSFSNHRLAHHPSICTHCGRRFSMPSSLESHLQLECGRKKETGFQCHICHKYMSTKKILNRHLRLHTNSGNHTCHLCSKSFGLRSSLEFHMKTHDSNKPYKCNVCHTTFTEKSTAIRHVKKQHSETNYNSYIENNLKPANPVELASKIKINLLDEMKNDEKLSNSSEKEVKSSSSSLKSLLEQPMTKMLESESILGKKVEARIKSQSEFVSKVKSEKELHGTVDAIESDDDEMDSSLQQGDYFKVYKCKLCEKSYHHSSSLNKHMKKHDSSKFVTCYICKKVCVSEEDFQLHFTLHSSTKTYVCPLCGAKIARRSSVLRHIRKTHKYSNEAARDLLNQHLASLDTAETARSEADTTFEDSVDEEIKSEIDTKPDISEPEQVGEAEMADPEPVGESEIEEPGVAVEQTKVENQADDFEHFTCYVCEQIFLEKAKLTMHLLTIHKLSEEEALLSSGLRINDERESEKPSHFTCSLCQQIFLERFDWKKHLCELHGLSQEEAETCIQLESGEPVPISGSATAKVPSIVNVKTEKPEMHTNLFDLPLNVTVEKDREGVQKVIKVMPEVPVTTQPGGKNESQYKPYSCSMCGTRFVEKSSVRRHLKRTHKFSPEEAREYMIRADYTKEPNITNKIVPVQHTSTPVKAESNDSLLDGTENDSSYMDDEDKEDQSNSCQRTFLCSLCKRRFMLRSSVRRHLRKVHHFTPEEARECDILAEENKDQIYRIRKPPELEKSKEMDSTSNGDKIVSKNKQKTDISCKICKQKFSQRFGLKRHLINVHKLESQEVESFMEEQMNEMNPGENQTCSLCFSVFDTRPKLRVHLIKLHRLSELVADRILLGEEMSDYTEGIEPDVLNAGTEMDVSDNLEESGHKRTNSQMNMNHEGEEAENFDVDDDSNEMKLGNSSDVMFGLKGEKDLLAEMNFEAINPWGTEIKSDVIESDNLGINEPGSNTDIDFSLAEEDKLMDSTDGQDPMSIGLLPQDIENDGDSKAESIVGSVGTLGNTSLPAYMQKRSYDCPICGRVMSDASARSKHIRRHEGRAGFKCGLCDKIFPQLRLIESHLKTHCGFGVKCGICFIYCAERHGAKRHIHRIHNIEPNTEESEKNILTCSLDAPNVQENMHNYTVIDLSKQKDIIEIVPNTLLGKASDLEKWRQETAEAKAKEKLDLRNSVGEMNEKVSVKTEVDLDSVQSDSIMNQSNLSADQNGSGDSRDSTQIFTDGIQAKMSVKPKKATRIDSVISSLHKKLLTKSVAGSDTDDQSDSGSQTENDSPKSVYSAENFSPLKIKLTKKFTVEKSPKKSASSEVEKDNENGSDSDQTVDFDFEERASGKKESIIKKEPVDNIQKNISVHNDQMAKDVALLDQELMKAFIPELSSTGSMGNLNTLEITLNSLKQKEKEEQPKPTPHLICWECGKSYSNYKSYREHRRKKHPLSCNQCRQVGFTNSVIL